MGTSFSWILCSARQRASGRANTVDFDCFRRKLRSAGFQSSSQIETRTSLWRLTCLQPRFRFSIGRNVVVHNVVVLLAPRKLVGTNSVRDRGKIKSLPQCQSPRELVLRGLPSAIPALKGRASSAKIKTDLDLIASVSQTDCSPRERDGDRLQQNIHHFLHFQKRTEVTITV